ncbi:MAG: hypothetical protein RBS89_07265 [Candidatus Delongbacteria bacterium]|nr:hypothetical protein [Candidatus Delongbacteria bacterium]
MNKYDQNNDIKTLREFLSYPLNSTDGIFERFSALPGAKKMGTAPARFVYVPGYKPDAAVLVAHADTVWTIAQSRSGVTGIGADDRAGCAILWLLRDSGHSLLITDGEERGCLGASYASRCIDIDNELNAHTFMVEFDRRGANDFKCYDVGTPEFRSYVADMMPGYTEPDRSSCTDICVLCKDICGVNLSIGYYNEHTTSERIEEDEWHATLTAARKWLLDTELKRFELKKNQLRHYVA